MTRTNGAPAPGSPPLPDHISHRDGVLVYDTGTLKCDFAQVGRVIDELHESHFLNDPDLDRDVLHVLILSRLVGHQQGDGTCAFSEEQLFAAAADGRNIDLADSIIAAARLTADGKPHYHAVAVRDGMRGITAQSGLEEARVLALQAGQDEQERWEAAWVVGCGERCRVEEIIDPARSDPAAWGEPTWTAAARR
ncbi:hypothetical protein LV457_05800 [Mycobacterium sp. MYCO198283]|uniref:hypothetical protein n=1 Tax=Mycobacterium sp. MYCO198283 TaxID=2883505 RepID=UPI001E5278A8|nr:hypothetical protein [Mycobacterium sp. MYCO198283]MCG5431805.1 hypothetical protein [Mycobacterium sp. MYCO198283]